MPTTDELKQLLLTALKNSPYKEKIGKLWLFGSYADGTATEQSDIDLILELKEPMGLSYMDLWDDFENRLGKRIDFVAPECVNKYIRPYVDKQKILIYG
jgi:hypothetical protein